MKREHRSAGGWLNAILSFVYPETCQICKSARAGKTESYVCGACREKIRFIQEPFCHRCGLPHQGAITGPYECGQCQETGPHFLKARSAVVARDVMLEIIHQYKYNRALWFEPLLRELLTDRALPELQNEKWDLIVPIPLHPTKQREREFNQAERLGRALSENSGIPMDSRLIKRVVATRTQTLLSREERLKNMRKAFAMAGNRELNGERIVLVDDVFTTGATTSSCARTLRDAGAADVCVWTVARGT